MKYILPIALTLLVLFGVTLNTTFANKSDSSSSTKAESSTGTLWVEEDKDTGIDYLNSTKPPKATNTKPFRIIGVIVVSLILVIGVMVWSILQVNNKKKSAEKITDANNRNHSKNYQKPSNFKLIDSFAIDKGKTLYLVQLFDKKYVLGSTWGSICFINEFEGQIENVFENKVENIIEDKVVEENKEINIEEKSSKQAISHLDFLTPSEEIKTDDSQIEEGFKALIKNVSAEFSQKSASSATKVLENLYEKIDDEPLEKAGNDYPTSQNTQSQNIGARKLSNTLKNQQNSDIQEENTQQPVNGQIKRSYTDLSSRLDAYTSVKKPSWLRERENKRNLVSSVFNKSRVNQQENQDINQASEQSEAENKKENLNAEILDLSLNNFSNSKAEETKASQETRKSHYQTQPISREDIVKVTGEIRNATKEAELETASATSVPGGSATISEGRVRKKISIVED